jgi:hypothetical protein
MAKPIKSQWQLQELVTMEVAQHASRELIVPCVHPMGHVEWDEERKGLGRTAWGCGFIRPQGRLPLDVMTKVRAAVVNCQRRFDLGLTAA